MAARPAKVLGRRRLRAAGEPNVRSRRGGGRSSRPLAAPSRPPPGLNLIGADAEAWAVLTDIFRYLQGAMRSGLGGCSQVGVISAPARERLRGSDHATPSP